MKKIQQNKIQIYLSGEIKQKFDEYCEENNLKASAAGSHIISQYLSRKSSRLIPDSFPTQELETLKKDLESIKRTERDLKNRLDGNFLLEKRVNHIDSFLSEHFQDAYKSSYWLNKNVNPLPVKNSDSESSDSSESFMNQSESEQDLEQGPSEEEDYSSDIVISKSKIIIPKDIQKKNSEGGVEIADANSLDKKVIYKYFFYLISNKFVLKGTDKSGKEIWICGSKYVKPSEDPTQAKLYQSKKRTELAAKKLEEKYSLNLELEDSYLFVVNQPLEKRGQILENWGIEFSFTSK